VCGWPQNWPLIATCMVQAYYITAGRLQRHTQYAVNTRRHALIRLTVRARGCYSIRWRDLRPGRFFMDRPDFGAPDEPAHEPLQRELALYAFVREEDEREVRMFFRDTPPSEIAASFRRAGAAFITITGERAFTPPPDSAPAADEQDPDAPKPASARARRARRKLRRQSRQGEATLRYFYSLGEIVYTAIVSAPSGIVRSIAPVYPAAAISERELQERLALVFAG
jgi:hypothetical protein